MKTRKLNALLAGLITVCEGEISAGSLRGSYRGYLVQARPHSGYPINYLAGAPEGSVGPEPVNMLEVTLAGVTGRQSWHCQSSAGSYLHDLSSRFTAGPLLGAFTSGEFKFEGVDTLKDSVEQMGEKFVKRLGMPITANADPDLQERLIGAGLFEELDALRLGGHPYLPKVQFTPGGRELAQKAYLNSPAFAQLQPAVEERLRVAGLPDCRSLMEATMHEIEHKNPGRLQLEVEAGRATVPSADQFRELLERAVRISQINAEVN